MQGSRVTAARAFGNFCFEFCKPDHIHKNAAAPARAGAAARVLFLRGLRGTATAARGSHGRPPKRHFRPTATVTFFVGPALAATSLSTAPFRSSRPVLESGVQTCARK